METFDPKSHTYKIDGRVVPSVTEVLNDLLPQWQAGDWYLQRGREIHAACALLLRGRKFSNDPRIDGPIAACNRFLTDTSVSPIEIETPHFDSHFQFGGTPDCIASVQFEPHKAAHRCVLEWKSGLSKTASFQLGAYGLLTQSNYGVVVELRDDGRYKSTGPIKLDLFKRQFYMMLSTYQIRKSLGYTKKTKEEK